MSEKKKKPLYKRWWFWVLAIIIVAGIAGCGGESSDQTKESEKKQAIEKSTTTTATPKEESKKAEIKKEEPAKKEEAKNNTLLMDGENGVLADDVLVALGEDKTNYEEMFNYITANNKEALERMILEGKVVFASKGTPITVVDRGFINAKIEIIETGQRGWVPVEYLARSVK
jgi:hypothetical protein